jgi:DNA-binding LytR/AlgR family response regulator
MIHVATTMAAMEQLLPSDRFLRVHKSFIAALGRIDRVAANTLHVGEDEIPVGRSYRREVGRIVDRRR